MEIEDIPADQTLVMTENWIRAFKSHGCAPMCHCCMKRLAADDKFKLATVETYDRDTSNSGINVWATTDTREVMLCDSCSVDKFNKMTKSARKKYEKFREEGGGCFRVNGKIIH